MNTVCVKLLSFAAAKDAIGHSEINIQLNSIWENDQQLLDHICALFPSLSVLRPSLVLAINEEYVFMTNSIVLHSMDTLALIPPITGG